MHRDLLPGPAPTLLPDDAPVRDALARGEDPASVAAAHPAASAAWAALAERALADGADGGAGGAPGCGAAGTVAAYAYARTGYHRGLDALRRNGWKGAGPVPWSHAPNQGFLRCLHALHRAAAGIGEAGEADRCAQFLRDCDPAAPAALTGGDA